MTFWQSVVLGCVEGWTEFIPVSSTAHLILSAHLMRIPQSEFLKTFEVAIQSGAILSVVAVYLRQLLDLNVWKKVLAAFIPTAVIGFLLRPVIKAVFFESTELILAALFIGGVILILFEKHYQKNPKPAGESADISYKTCLWLGVFQAIAVIPGVSRSGATIIGGLAMGIDRKRIVEFSFLLAVPTLLAATALDLVKTSLSFSGTEWLYLGTGFTASFLFAWLAIRFLLKYIQANDFISFGIYRIILALVAGVILL